MREQTVLVTGATGFVGKALVQRLLSHEGTQVRAGTRSRLSAVPAGAEQVVIDLEDNPSAWAQGLDGVDVVVHCAAQVPGSREEDETAYRRINVEATLRLAHAAAAAGVRRFVFLSSIKVNGESSSTGKPFTANATAAPQDEYARSKHVAEQELLVMARHTTMDVVIVRTPLVYGPGVGGNFERMWHWVERGLPLPLGAVRNCRSLVALGNLTDFLLTCVAHPVAANRVWMVSDGDDVSTAELLRRIGRAVGRPARLVPVPPVLLRLFAAIAGRRGLGLARRLCDSLQVDVAETQEQLGWIPPVTMVEEFERMQLRRSVGEG